MGTVLIRGVGPGRIGAMHQVVGNIARMKRPNPFVDALLIAGIAGLLVLYCVRHRLLEPSDKRLLTERALARYGGWTHVSGNHIKEMDAVEEKQTRELFKNSIFRKYLFYATKNDREYSAEFNDQLADLKIEVNLYPLASIKQVKPSDYSQKD